MNANEFGKRLGIGVRVAGRIAQQRAQEREAQSVQAQTVVPSQNGSRGPEIIQPQRFIPSAQEIREVQQKTHRITRAAGRGIGGFLRPFGRIGGILWLQVTGFFFGMFAVYFAQDLWRTHASYAAGPQHQRFLIAVVMTVVFGYLSVSAFWRARSR